MALHVKRTVCNSLTQSVFEQGEREKLLRHRVPFCIIVTAGARQLIDYGTRAT